MGLLENYSLSHYGPQTSVCPSYVFELPKKQATLHYAPYLRGGRKAAAANKMVFGKGSSFLESVLRKRHNNAIASRYKFLAKVMKIMKAKGRKKQQQVH